MTFGSKRLDDAYDRWATQSPDDFYSGDEEMQDIEGDLAEEHDLNKEQEEKMETKINKDQCKRSELRDVTISVRVTKSMSKFMADNEFSPSRVLIQALYMLGYKDQ